MLSYLDMERIFKFAIVFFLFFSFYFFLSLKTLTIEMNNCEEVCKLLNYNFYSYKKAKNFTSSCYCGYIKDGKYIFKSLVEINVENNI